MGEDAQQTKADGREPPIPGNAFASVGVASTRGSQSLYPKSIAVDRLIMRSVRTLGVTRVPCPGFAKPDPWTGVPGAFLGILGLIELPEATAT